jgi:tetratricopeptide (TPR) repeat protein
MYMVPRVDASWPMQPELYMNLGTVLALQNKDGEALQSMLKAIELDPKLARAYSVTASHYEKLKKKDEALKLVTEGLRQIPDSTSLQRLYVKLGGQLPYPEPVVPQEPQSVEEPNPEVAVESPVRANSDAVPVAQSVNAEPGMASEESTAAEAETVAPPEIGSPSNPWCRFCPPEPGQ